MNEKVIKKFWASVEKTDNCWNWIGPICKNGLPIIRHIINGKFTEISPRRLSLQINGKKLDKSERAQPLICKNKLCINPTHLVIGDVARFWSKVNRLSGEDSCWIWTASHDKNMYGKFRIFEKGNKTDIRAHIYSWQLFSGRKIPDGVLVCHTCDHPYCVNPKHLFLGTVKDNNDDKISKGRQAKGEKIFSSKLTKEQVIKIRELIKSKTIKELSKIYRVARSTIHAVISRKTWRHVL